MKPETYLKVLKLISDASDAEVRGIVEAAVARRKFLTQEEARINRALLKEGDRVKLKNVKPKYLNGTPGTIVGMKGSQFIVQLDTGADPRAQRRFSSRPVCPANILEKI